MLNKSGQLPGINKLGNRDIYLGQTIRVRQQLCVGCKAARLQTQICPSKDGNNVKHYAHIS